MFGYYKFSTENGEKLNDLCKNFEDHKTLAHSPWSVLLLGKDKVKKKSDSFSNSLNISSHAEANKVESVEDPELINLDSSSEEVCCPLTFQIPLCTSSTHNEDSSVQDKVEITENKTLSIVNDAEHNDEPLFTCTQDDINVANRTDFVQVLQHIQDEVCKLKEYLSNDSGVSSIDANFLSALTPNQMEALIDHLDLPDIVDNEAPFCSLCSVIGINSDCTFGFNTGLSVIMKFISPSIQRLNKTASRRIIDALLSIFGAYPLLASHFVIDVLSNNGVSSTVCQQAVADVAIKIIKDVLNCDGAKLVLINSLSAQNIIEDRIVSVIHCLLEKMVNISQEELQLLIRVLDKSKDAQAKNLKFAKLVLIVIQQYGRQMTEHDTSLIKSVASKNKTFLKRSLQSSLENETYF